MSEELYRRGYQDGWFYDDNEVKDPDYVNGLNDGKAARIKMENKRREKCFGKRDETCKTTTS